MGRWWTAICSRVAPVARYASCGAPTPMMVGQTTDETAGWILPTPAAHQQYPSPGARALVVCVVALGASSGVIHRPRRCMPTTSITSCPGTRPNAMARCPHVRCAVCAGHAGVLVQRPLTDGDHELGARMNAYWLDFIRTGNPNGPGRPQWPALDLSVAGDVVQCRHPGVRLECRGTPPRFGLCAERLAQGGAATIWVDPTPRRSMTRPGPHAKRTRRRIKRSAPLRLP